MDVSFSAKPQTFSLISSPPLPSSSSSWLSLLSPCRIRSLRREFLGSGHNLRPSGLRSRRKCKKLGFHIQSPRILFKASLDSQSMFVVVSVVTVSALTVVYLNYSKRKEESKEISGQLTLALSQQIRSMMNWDIMDRSSGPVERQGETSADENRGLMKEMRDIIDDSEDKVAQLQFRETALMHDSEVKVAPLQFKETAMTHEETLITASSKSPDSDIIASSIGESISSIEFEVTRLSSLPSLLHESGALPFASATEMCEMHLEVCEQETELGSELRALMAKTEMTAASVTANNVLGGMNELEKPNHELVKEGEISSYNGIFGESVRKELYTFFEVNQSAMRSMENFNGMKSLSSHASLAEKNCFSSLMKSSTVEGAKFSAQTFLPTAEGKPPVGCHKEGSFRKWKDLGKGRGFSSDKGKRTLHQNDHQNLFSPPHPKGKHINDRHYPSQQFSAYNLLLREERLIDCIEFLEDMKTKGVLDMDKVYHAGFFRVCKSQKSVKVAFCFTKLIPNPTLSTFNMLMSVCASSQDSEGAFQVLKLVQEAGLKADCKLYTTLITTCAKCGKVDVMFKVFHEMVNAGVEPNVHTYGALIDGCAKAAQVAKAFGAYGIMRSKNVKPDRVVFNALITACGQSGAVDRAFDVLAEMRAETQPIDPDHVTVGALIKACTNAGQVDRAREVYNMIQEYNIEGTPEVYTIAVNSCSQTGDWEFARNVYNDMTRKGVVPDEMFFSALIDVAGHAEKLDAAFEILQEASTGGIRAGIISYSSLMGACCNAKNWQKALELYEDIKTRKLKPTVSTMNALITALCDGDQLQKAVEVFIEMKRLGLCPNTITYSILFVASEKKDDLDVGLMLHSQAKKDGLAPNLVMCRCLVVMCLRRFQKACTNGEPVLSFNSGWLQIDSKWTSLVLMVYRETIMAGVVPTMEEFSQVLGCLRLPHDVSLRNRLIENLGVSTDTSKVSNLCSLIDGFAEYDPRAFSLLEEAASLGIVPCVSLKKSPIVVDLRKLQIYTAEVYLLTVLKGLKHRLAAGAKVPNITILLPIEKTHIQFSKGEKKVNLAGRISQAVAALLRRLGMPYLGNESYGKIRINGIVVRKWFQPKLAFPLIGKPTDFSSSQSWLGRGITHQQRSIRTGNLSLE